MTIVSCFCRSRCLCLCRCCCSQSSALRTRNARTAVFAARPLCLSSACMLRCSLEPLSLLLPRSCVHWTCTLCALSVFHSSCAPLSVDDLLIFAHFLHFYGFLHYFYTSYFVVVVVSVVDAFVAVVLGAYVYGLWFFLSFFLVFWSANLVAFQLLHSSASSSSSLLLSSLFGSLRPF